MSSRKILTATAIGTLTLIGLLLVYSQFIRPSIEDSALPPCSQLPTERAVEQALEQHRDMVESLQAMEKGGSVMIFADAPSDCPNRSALRITYGTQKTRDEIRHRLGDTFFGIPYRMQNV